MSTAVEPQRRAATHGKPCGRSEKGPGHRLFACWIGLCLCCSVWLLATRPWVRLGMRFINSQAVQELGGIGYAGFDGWDLLHGEWRNWQLRSLDAAPYRAYLSGLAAKRRSAPLVALPRRHVVFVQLESVDGLVIGSRYKGRPLMPFLDKLAREEVYFANVIDNTASGRTTDGELLVLTSQVPLRSAPAYVSQPLDRVPSLPKTLKAAGYRTWSMHGYDGAFWRREAAHRAIGFDDMFFREDLDDRDRIGWGISDHSVLQQAARRLASAREPTFAHVILLTNHHPCSYVRAHRGHPASGVVADYVESVGYVDESIAAFFATLEAEGVLQDCIVAVFGDHDSGLTRDLERGLTMDSGRLYPDTLPLIVAGLPEAPRRIDAIAGMQDLPVLVLEALGLRVPATFTGNSLDHTGRTVGALHGALESAPQGVRSSAMPVDQETLTLLALRQPEKLKTP